MTVKFRLLLLALLLVLTACVGATDESVDVDESADDARSASVAEERDPPAAPTDEPDPTPTSTAVPAVEADAALAPLAGGKGIISDDGARWSVVLGGLIEANPDPQGTERCLTLFGTITPEELRSGFVSSGPLEPRILLKTDAELHHARSFAACGVSVVEAAGYRPIFDAESTVGTAVPFYVNFVVPSEEALQEVRIAPLRRDDVKSFLPDMVDSVPAPDLGEPGPPPATAPLVGATMMAELDGTWEISLAGVVQIETKLDLAGEAVCIAVYGTGTPITLDSGLVTAHGSMPQMGIIANGKLLADGIFECDDSGLRDAGYATGLGPEITAGTPFPFFRRYVLPADHTIDAVFVGATWNDEVQYFSADVDQAITPATIDLTNRTPIEPGPLTDIEFEIQDGDAIIISLNGITEHQPAEVRPGRRCLAVTGMITMPAGFPLGDIQLGVVADGVYRAFRGDCGASADLEALGYRVVDQVRGEVSDGTPVAFYGSGLVREGAALEAIIVGEATRDGTITLAPELLPTAPAPGS